MAHGYLKDVSKTSLVETVRKLIQKKIFNFVFVCYECLKYIFKHLLIIEITTEKEKGNHR